MHQSITPSLHSRKQSNTNRISIVYIKYYIRTKRFKYFFKNLPFCKDNIAGHAASIFPHECVCDACFKFSVIQCYSITSAKVNNNNQFLKNCF